MAKILKSVFATLGVAATLANAAPALAQESTFCDSYFATAATDCHANWQSYGLVSEAECIEAAYAGVCPNRWHPVVISGRDYTWYEYNYCEVFEGNERIGFGYCA
ncbi:hypothetical protein P1X14_05205 [Sphingomonas sp. AOB5]|uniref:hypothetical protein n=1 Tax=Sphingomonas sp. AOB5 TaxID=3034017 RepID=UPI0023F8E3B9|nr:hypothetical protein [Sphingomonas sp. AOB5]MDF7774636.1 hypothetical protein [Sphingomonas sp. AOB5]